MVVCGQLHAVANFHSGKEIPVILQWGLGPSEWIARINNVIIRLLGEKEGLNLEPHWTFYIRHKSNQA
jgi:hypothetical protein